MYALGVWVGYPASYQSQSCPENDPRLDDYPPIPLIQSEPYLSAQLCLCRNKINKYVNQVLLKINSLTYKGLF